MYIYSYTVIVSYYTGSGPIWCVVMYNVRFVGSILYTTLSPVVMSSINSVYDVLLDQIVLEQGPSEKKCIDIY